MPPAVTVPAEIECLFLTVPGVPLPSAAAAAAAAAASNPSLACRARLATVSRGYELGGTTTPARIGRALNSRRRRSSSSCARSRASRSSRLRREMASPGSSKLARVGALVDRTCGFDGECASAVADEEGPCSDVSCSDRRAARCSFSRRATASPGSSNVDTVGGLLDRTVGRGGSRLVGRGMGLRADDDVVAALEAALSSSSCDASDVDLRTDEARPSVVPRTVVGGGLRVATELVRFIVDELVVAGFDMTLLMLAAGCWCCLGSSCCCC